MSHKFKGVGVAVVTAFDNDGQIDYDAQARIYDHISRGNPDFIVLLGSTGEAATISVEEQTALLTFTREHLQDQTLVLGVSGSNTQEVIDRLKHFDLDLVDGILTSAPSYNKPTQEGIYQHFKNICASIDKPVIIYNVPSRTGSNIDADTCIRIAQECDNAVAIKEASGDFLQVMRIIHRKPEKFTVLCGDDFFALPMIGLGAEGLISVIGNAYPKETVELVQSALSNDMPAARKMHYDLLNMLHLIFEEGNPAGIKSVLSLMNKSTGEVRLPLIKASSELMDRIKRAVPG